jgi:hypothetical protein
MNRGPFVVKNVFGMVEYGHAMAELMELYEANKFESRLDDADVGIQNHPKWVREMPTLIQDRMINVLKDSGIASAFGFSAEQALKDSVSKSFVLLYEPQQINKSLQNLDFSLHKDVADGANEGRHILSVVLTFRSADCIGGALGFSNRKDGEVYRTEELTTFLPKDNSIYCLNGDFVSHCAYGITSGIRFAAVLFIATNQSELEVFSLWNSVEPPQEVCLNCFSILNTRKQFIDHIRYICPGCRICCKTSYSLKKHVCNRSK